MKKTLFLSVCLVCIFACITSCAEPGYGSGNRQEEISRFEIRSADDIEVSIKELFSIPVGEGEGHVKCRKIPGYDYCPSNISFTEDGDICVTDCDGKKAEIYSKDGKHVKTISLALSDNPDANLSYSVYSNGSVYAIFDQKTVCKFESDGTEKCIKSTGQSIMLDVSQVDGRVVVFGMGSTDYITADGTLATEKDFNNVEFETDPENYMNIIGARYNRDGKEGIYKVQSSFGVNCTGIINDLLVLQDYYESDNVYKAYDHDGNIKFEILKKTFENDLAPIKESYEYNGKMYFLICAQDHTSVFEASVINK